MLCVAELSWLFGGIGGAAPDVRLHVAHSAHGMRACAPSASALWLRIVGSDDAGLAGFP